MRLEARTEKSQEGHARGCTVRRINRRPSGGRRDDPRFTETRPGPRMPQAYLTGWCPLSKIPRLGRACVMATPTGAVFKSDVLIGYGRMSGAGEDCAPLKPHLRSSTNFLKYRISCKLADRDRPAVVTTEHPDGKSYAYGTYSERGNAIASVQAKFDFTPRHVTLAPRRAHRRRRQSDTRPAEAGEESPVCNVLIDAYPIRSIADWSIDTFAEPGYCPDRNFRRLAILLARWLAGRALRESPACRSDLGLRRLAKAFAVKVLTHRGTTTSFAKATPYVSIGWCTVRALCDLRVEHDSVDHWTLFRVSPELRGAGPYNCVPLPRRPIDECRRNWSTCFYIDESKANLPTRVCSNIILATNHALTLYLQAMMVGNRACRFALHVRTVCDVKSLVLRHRFRPFFD